MSKRLAISVSIALLLLIGCSSSGSGSSDGGGSGPTAPTISFTVANHFVGDVFPVSATSNSTGVFTYTVVSGPATISGSTVTVTGIGTVTLQASQAAAGNYTAGSQIASFTASGITPSLTLSIPNTTYSATPFSIAAASNSSGVITYSVTSGPATISGSTVTLNAIGTVVIAASQAASGNYTAASTSSTFTVAAAAPSLTFSIPNTTYSTTPFSIAAASNSSGVITYSVTSGPATISGSTVTLNAIGTVVIAASQAASGNYTAASTSSTFTVAAAAPSLTFSIANTTYSTTPFSIGAASNSSGVITYSVTSGPATISGSTVTLNAIGTVVIAASQAASGNYTAASTSSTFTVAAAAPSLTFSIANTTYSTTPFSIGAASNSSGVITYSVTSGPATISGSTVTLNAIGTVVIAASQAASGNYAAASTSATFTVAAAAPSLTFSIANTTYSTTPFSIGAASNSSGAITYSVTSGPATISGSSVTLTGIGTVVIKASQAASGNYASGSASATFTVAVATPSLQFTIANQTYGVTPFSVAATSNSPGAITYSVTSGSATISGSTVTVTGAGTVVIMASQAASGNYAAASVSATFYVSGIAPSLSFSIRNHTFGDAPFTVAATSNSSGTISYSIVDGPGTLTGASLLLTGSGSVVVQASQAAAGNYAAATLNATFAVSGTATTESCTPTVTHSSGTSGTYYNTQPAINNSEFSTYFNLRYDIGPAYLEATNDSSTPTYYWYDNRLAAIDMEGNCRYDIIEAGALNTSTPTVDSSYITSQFRVLHNNGDGTFSDASATLFPGGVPQRISTRAMVTPDLNNDGIADIFMANQGIDNAPSSGEPATLALSSLGPLSSSYTDDSSAVAAEAGFGHTTAAGAIFGGVTQHLYVGNLCCGTGNGAAPYLLLNDGLGNLTVDRTRLPAEILALYNGFLENSFTSSAFVDILKTGYPALILGTDSPVANLSSRVYLNDGTGYFNKSAAIPLPKGCFLNPDGSDNSIVLNIESTDVDGDGYPDLILVETQLSPFYTGRCLQVLINNHDGTFNDQTSTRITGFDTTQTWAAWVRILDINGDGYPDLVVQDDSANAAANQNTVLLNNGSGVFRALPINFFPVAGAISGMMQPIDLYGDGHISFIQQYEGYVGYDRYSHFAIYEWNANMPTPP